MINRIKQKFVELKKKQKKAFIAYITAGDPNLGTTVELVRAFDQAGVDIVELGVPFSDPLADGTTIQMASQRALKQGVTINKILQAVQRIRQTRQIPIALMTYYNPIFHYGLAAFLKKARQAGVDGVIVPDLPPEEGQDLIREAKRNDLATVFFLSPTTQVHRMARIAKASTGFVYYVSVTGITGARQILPKELIENIKKVKRLTDKPICVGFGVSTPEQVKQLSQAADGVIVGSAIIKQIEKHSGQKDLIKSVSRFVQELAKPLKVHER